MMEKLIGQMMAVTPMLIPLIGFLHSLVTG